MFDFLLKYSPAQISVLLQKANALYEEQNFISAIPLYKKILKSDSSHFAALANLAVCYFETEEYAMAIPLLRQVAKLDLLNPWWQNYLSQSYQKTGDFFNALESAWQAVELSGGQKEHHLNMAYTIYEISDEKGADGVKDYLKKWYKKYSDNGIVQQSYKSFFCDEDFAKSNLEYVENLFDVFAPDFDNVLAGLEYHSPDEIARELAVFLNEKKQKDLYVLDLGCGSGLCGKNIKNYLPSGRIFGVDISEKMLVEAKAKQVYEKLIKSDITDCFNLIKKKFDIVVASDVFTYFGILDSIFFGVAKCLKKYGLFAFTVSLNQTNKKDWFLLPCSRFVHSEKYIKNILEKNGFSVLKDEEKILRREGGKNVVGRLFIACKK